MTLTANLSIDKNNFGVWNPNVTQARSAFLDHLVVWSPMVENFADLNPRAKLFVMSLRDIEHTENITYAAIKAGRLIDFGHLPNAGLLRQAAIAAICASRGPVLWAEKQRMLAQLKRLADFEKRRER